MPHTRPRAALVPLTIALLAAQAPTGTAQAAFGPGHATVRTATTSPGRVRLAPPPQVTSPRPAPAVGSPAPGSAAVRAQAAETGVDTFSRSAVTTAYRGVYLPALDVPIGWTGSVSGCAAGTHATPARTATLTAINYFRSMGGLTPASLDAARLTTQQATALVMSANHQLSHSIDASWRCYTSAAATGASTSNLALGAAGAQAIGLYMNDAGIASVGHRRWVMSPATTVMASGSTSDANALFVIGPRASTFANPTWVPWPTPGYFPAALEPGGYWSLTADDRFRYTFAGARVSVTDPLGRRVPVNVLPAQQGFGNDTLVWTVSEVPAPTGGRVDTYTVAVTGITDTLHATTVSTSYTVGLYDPAAAVPRWPGDTTGDAVADVWTVDAGGTIAFREGSVFRPLTARGTVATGRTDITWLTPGPDLTADGRPDLILWRTDGSLWAQPTSTSGVPGTPSRIGSGWNGMDALVPVGAIAGGATQYLLARGAADGTLWRYRLSATGISGSPVRIGTGWRGFRILTAPGDVTGDGRADLVGIRSDGTLWVYPGTPAGTLGAGVRRGQGWSGITTAVVAGDLSGDGRGDLLARRADGNLYTYPQRPGSGGSWGPARLVATGVSAVHLA